MFVPNSWDEIDLFIDNNIKITLNSLAYCKKNNAKNIYVSSYIYGNTKLPTKESEPVKINNPYYQKKWEKIFVNFILIFTVLNR